MAEPLVDQRLERPQARVGLDLRGALGHGGWWAASRPGGTRVTPSGLTGPVTGRARATPVLPLAHPGADDLADVAVAALLLGVVVAVVR
ncbi:MAG: hypothetical protein IPI35_20480 [Deltaproteobacteria bacterium]|nr:hypothetical protein [Deltaproteobacteria bacterium]